MNNGNDRPYICAMETLHAYDTAVEALNDLKTRGYTVDFNMAFNKLVSLEKGHELEPEDFEIREFYRFEGDSNPADEEILFAIESQDGKIKGVLTAAFGTYADAVSENLLKKLAMHLS